jgi:LysR family glycine cleavage system transcriptional activator
MVQPFPPLNALRAFEAAARLGTYVAAAGELGVTPAAVSAQVRRLEGWLGKELFERRPSGVVLTDAGRAVALRAGEAMAGIGRLAQETMATAPRPRTVISAIASVSRLWLVPELAALVRDGLGFGFELREEPDPVDFAGAGIELRLTYGADLYPEARTVILGHDAALPLASPDYLLRNPAARAPGLAGVPDADLIHTDWGPRYGSHPTWAAWFAAGGIARRPPARGHRVGMSGLALDLAREGAGVALGLRMLAARDLAAGRLVALSQRALPSGEPYVLVMPRGAAPGRAVQALVERLTAAARAAAG